MANPRALRLFAATLALAASAPLVVSADPPRAPATTPTASTSTPAVRAPRESGAPLPQACEQDPFHVDYGPIREGTLVRLGRHRSVDGNANWDPSMEHYVGRVTPVVAARGLDPQGCAIVEVAVDGGEYVWRVRDLAIVAEAPSTEDGAVPELRLGLGMVPDPRVYDTAIPELTRRASTLKAGCAGWIGARPTFRLMLEDDFTTLALMARSRVDAILVVHLPSGEYVCVDDVEGRDPVLTGRAVAGRYEIFVGAFEPVQGSPSVRIGLSERATVRTASLDSVSSGDVRALIENDRGRGTTRLQPGRPSRSSPGETPPPAPAPAEPPSDDEDGASRRNR